MTTKLSCINLSIEQQSELGQCVLTPGWRVVSPTELPSIFPERFREKVDSALLISMPTSTGGTYLAYNANRVDFKDRAIDIEPMGLIVHSTGASPSAVFLHHGDWEGRTTSPTTQFWDEVSRSGIGDYYLTNPPGGLREGTLEQLPTGHREAFETLVREIRLREDGDEK